MSHQPHTLHKPSGQMKSPHSQLMELILRLQQTLDDYIMQLETRHLHQELEQNQRHSQDTREQEVKLIQLMCHVVNTFQSGAANSLELQLDSRGDVGCGQQAQTSRQPCHQSSDLKASCISNDLSNSGTDICVLYQSIFQDITAYHGDKYDEEKNPSVRTWEWGGHIREPQSLGFTESCAKCCAPSLTLLSPTK